MTSVTITIEGLDEIVAKIDSIDDWRGLQAAMLAVGTHVKGKVDKYPRATDANSPRDFVSGGKNTWYQRGYGPKWARKDGTVGGRKTSETLGRRWTVKATSAQVVIGNNVSYGPYVQDEENQAEAHKRHGWKTIQTIAEEEEATVRQFLEDYLSKMLK